MRVKLNSNGYTKIYDSGLKTSIVGGYDNDAEVQEFLTNGGVIEPEFTDVELLTKTQAEFRSERSILLNEADIVVFKLEDNQQDASAWRTYRQALRDATISWVMPVKPV